MSSATRKIQQIKSLLSNQNFPVQGKDVIILVGPTGSGKSTILNIIAGNKIICKIGKKGTWEVQAENNVAMIGHKTSMTFFPNQWTSPTGECFYDCPGFNDSRGPTYDIAKSYFLKKLATSAKSLKVIFVGDFMTLHAVRSGTFGQVIRQTQHFLTSLNIQKDCQVIITKADEGIISEHVHETLLQNLDMKIPKEKITVMSKPSAITKELPNINMGAIIERCPSISSKCETPLSKQAEVYLNELEKEVATEMLYQIQQLLNSLRMYYVLILANNLDASPSQVLQWHKQITNSIKSISQINSIDTLKSCLQTQATKLQHLDHKKSQFICFQYIQNIHKKIQQIQFIYEISQYDINRVQQWKRLFKFDQKQIKNQSKITSFNSAQTFKLFMDRQMPIDGTRQIRQQIHQKLNKQQIIITPYSGTKWQTGTQYYSGRVNYRGSLPFKASVSFDQTIPYEKSVSYSGHAPYSGFIQTPNCSHKFFVGNYCLSCSHYAKKIQYSGTVPYSGSKHISGATRYCSTQAVQGVVEFKGDKQYNGNLQYNIQVSYKGTSQSGCRDHHRCSCSKLAMVAISAIEIRKQIEYYQCVSKLQAQLLGKQTNSVSTQPIQLEMRISGYDMVSEGALTQQAMANKIHSLLSKQHEYSHTQNGTTPYKTSQAHSGKVPYSGSQPYRGRLDHTAHKQYSGTAEYSGQQYYSGSLGVQSCYGDCSWCSGVNYWQKSYSGYAKYNGTQGYNGVVSKNMSKEYSGVVPYSGDAQYAIQVPISGTMHYTDTHTVTCKATDVGSGHHSCTSCDVWVQFINSVRALIKNKQRLKQAIRKMAMQLASKC